MSTEVTDLHAANAAVRKELEMQGLRVADLWPEPESHPAVEQARLKDLQRWVRAYRACPDRKRLERQGFCYPPVQDGLDADNDWLIFSRWMAGRPLHWMYAEAFGPLPADESLGDDECLRLLERVTRQLATRSVVVELQERLPARVAYRCLKAELEAAPFDFTTAGTRCVVTGCSGYCPGCLQRPWCDLGQDSTFPEDEDAGELVCPDSVRAHFPRTPLPEEAQAQLSEH